MLCNISDRWHEDSLRRSILGASKGETYLQGARDDRIRCAATIRGRQTVKLPTLSNNGFLYHTNKHGQRWLTEAARRRVAFIVVVVVFTLISIGVIAWIVRP